MLVRIIPNHKKTEKSKLQNTENTKVEKKTIRAPKDTKS